MESLPLKRFPLPQMINGQSLYWQIYDNQDNGQQSLEQLVQADSLEKLLEVKTISFEIRSENSTVIDYLTKPTTLRRLLGFIFTSHKVDSTDKAVEVFGCQEALRNVFQTLLATPDLLKLPFECLCQFTPGLSDNTNEELQPGVQAPVHIYNGFQKLFQAMMMSPKRVQTLVSYLSEHPRYFRAWVSHIKQIQIFETLKTFVIEYKQRGDDCCHQVSQLMLRSGCLEALIRFVTSKTAPLECVSNSATLLAQAVA